MLCGVFISHFRDSVTGIISLFLQSSWIMNSAENRCAFVRAEYIRILMLLSQTTSSYRLPGSDSEEESGFQQTVNDETVDDSIQFVSDTAEQFNSSSLQCLDEAVDSEMMLILESSGVQKQCENDVRVLSFYQQITL